VIILAGSPATRKRLLLAAGELIEAGGFNAAVLAVAQRAGVASATVYRHFPAKAELFLEVFRPVCEGEERAMRAAADEARAA
jgi:AcrR family transcriptional regulator